MNKEILPDERPEDVAGPDPVQTDNGPKNDDPQQNFIVQDRGITYIDESSYVYS